MKAITAEYPGYDDVIESFEFDVLVSVEDNDYQGYTRVLFQDGDRYGFLLFGWGSCSGCDALQACDTPEDVADLQAELFGSIVWKDSKAEMAEFIRTRDWDVQPAGEDKEFIEKALEALS